MSRTNVKQNLDTRRVVGSMCDWRMNKRKFNELLFLSLLKDTGIIYINLWSICCTNT
jgi:uncharacterized protein YjiS (DUF1127 family)